MAAEAESMDVDSHTVPSTSSGSSKKRFEVKKVHILFKEYITLLLLNRNLKLRVVCLLLC